MKVFKGETKKVGFTVAHVDGDSFTIASGTYEIYDSKDLATAVATGNLTVDSADVYALIDFGSEDYEAGKTYDFYAEVTITGTGEVEREKQVLDVAA